MEQLLLQEAVVVLEVQFYCFLKHVTLLEIYLP